jgi:hypothetical protein
MKPLVDSLQKKISTSSFTNNEIKQKETYFYTLQGNKLQLTMPSENNDVVFYLEKL